MKLVLLLVLCSSVTAAQKVLNRVSYPQMPAVADAQENNWIIDQTVNSLVHQLIEFVRRLINNGSEAFGIPVLDPFQIEKFNVSVPAGFINLELDLEKVYATGVGGFVIHKSRFALSVLSFDLDVSVPSIDASAERYGFIGDLFRATPWYGAGRAVFKADGLRFRGKIYLKQSDDGTAVIIDRVEETTFQIPFFKSQLTGTHGGGDNDPMLNSIFEDVIFDYVHRFQEYNASLVARLLPNALNPTLEQLDTWKFLAPFVRH